MVIQCVQWLPMVLNDHQKGLATAWTQKAEIALAPASFKALAHAARVPPVCTQSHYNVGETEEISNRFRWKANQPPHTPNETPIGWDIGCEPGQSSG